MSRIRMFTVSSMLLVVMSCGFPLVSANASFPGSNGLIVFASDRDGDYEIFTMNADGTDVRQLTHNGIYDGAPSWSPDGSKIAFNSNRDGNAEIYVMNADGTGVKRLTRHQGWDAEPSWSPDGKRIVFESSRAGSRTGPGVDIWTMNAADGKKLAQLTTTSGDEKEPVWSPDGAHIAFVRTNGVLLR